jgi:hypothetical protein
MQAVLSETIPTAPPAVPEANPPMEAPDLSRVLVGMAGVLALGTAAAIGGHGVFPHVAPSGLWIGAGSLVLTAPALLVAHQFMGLDAAPEEVVAVLGETVARGGRLALGLVPFQAFFSASTERGPGLFALALAGIGAMALVFAGRHVMDAERRVTADLVQRARAHSLVMGWGMLTVLVGMRLAWAVL